MELFLEVVVFSILIGMFLAVLQLYMGAVRGLAVLSVATIAATMLIGKYSESMVVALGPSIALLVAELLVGVNFLIVSRSARMAPDVVAYALANFDKLDLDGDGNIASKDLWRIPEPTDQAERKLFRQLRGD